MSTMSDLEGWTVALTVLASTALVAFLSASFFTAWAKRAYESILNDPKTSCDIDTFVGALRDENPQHVVKAGKVVLLHKFRLGSRVASEDAISLETVDSPHVPGLKVTRRTGSATDENSSYRNVTALDQVLAAEGSGSGSKKQTVVVATIRMGFGHHRIAYSACSWALKAGHTTLFHDLLNIDSPESALIRSTDELYSRFSRYASELGGPVERLWGSVMLAGDADALRVAALTAAHLQPLLKAYPPDIPMICTHQLVALTAACLGFTNVINLVVDNYPQWFLAVPNTLNLVQGPVNYQAFLRMGVPPKNLQCAGHWCPAQMVDHLAEDCQRRIDRAATAGSKSSRKPLRLLIPVGGAGAQRKFIIGFIRALAGLVKAGEIQLLLNAGDHEHMKTAFLQVLDECGLEFDQVTDTSGVMAFQARLLRPQTEPNKAITLFCFNEYFPAVATTDILSRVADVLCCKPSELAFYCLPKLHIRRVGDHEADSARRSIECGDGTAEAREIPDAMEYIQLFLRDPDILTSMNQAILRNNSIGIYDGCKRAVELAVEVAAKSS